MFALLANYEHDSLVGQYVILSFTLSFGRGEVLGNELPTTQFSSLGIWCPTLVYNMSCSVFIVLLRTFCCVVYINGP